MTPEQLTTARDRITRGIPYDEIAKGLGFKNVTTEAIAAIAMEMRVEALESAVGATSRESRLNAKWIADFNMKGFLSGANSMEVPAKVCDLESRIRALESRKPSRWPDVLMAFAVVLMVAIFAAALTITIFPELFPHGASPMPPVNLPQP